MRRYQTSEQLRNEDNKRFFESQYHPEFPESDRDIYIMSKKGTRFDNLAYEYYGDQTLWWVIAKSNGLVFGSLVLNPGEIIRIPDPSSIDRIDLNLRAAQFRT